MPRTLISVNPLLPLTSLNNNTPSQKMEKENPISPSLCFPPPKTTITSIDLSHEWREEKDTKSSHLRRRWTRRSSSASHEQSFCFSSSFHSRKGGPEGERNNDSFAPAGSVLEGEDKSRSIPSPALNVSYRAAAKTGKEESMCRRLR